MKHFLRAVDKAVEVLSVAMTVWIIALVTLQIVMRYIFNNPLTWSEELARFGLVLLTFFGSSLAMSQDEHIYVSFVVDKLKGKARLVVMIISRVITCGFMIYLVYYGLLFALMNMGQKSPANNIPMGLIYLSIPLNAFLMLLYNMLLKIDDSEKDASVHMKEDCHR